MTPRGVLETVLYATDINAAERFFIDVVGLQRFSRDGDRLVFFRCGRGMLLIFNPDYTTTQYKLVAGSRIPPHGTRGNGHMAFSIDESEIEPWRAKLIEANIAIESEVTWPQGGYSIYFRDPAGNSIELASPKLWGLAEDDAKS